MKGYLYRGRHRKRTTTRSKVTRAGVLSILLSGGVVAFAPPASADTLDAIEQCESGGQLDASNGTHFGLYQFDLRTWRSVGGSGNPMSASRAEQRMRAEALMSQRGTQPWVASASCWHGKSGAVSAHAAPKQHKPAVQAIRRADPPAPAHHKPTVVNVRQRPTQRVPRATDTVTVRVGDTLSAIAAAHHESWRALWEKNRAKIGSNPDFILPGLRLVA